MTAVGVAPGIWVVGASDPAHPAFTDTYDCTQYLVAHDGAGVLIDSGSGRGVDRLLANIDEVLPARRLTAVLLTHCHADHAGGAAALLDLGVPVHASEHTRRALLGPDERLTQLGPARAAGVYPADFTMRPAVGIRALSPATSFAVAGGTIAPVEGPGHCDGHTAFLLECNGERSLFSGDTIFAGGRIAMQAISDCRLDAYAATVSQLDVLGIDRLLPGHGEQVSENAAAGIAAAAASFRALVPPPNFLAAPGFPQ